MWKFVVTILGTFFGIYALSRAHDLVRTRMCTALEVHVRGGVRLGCPRCPGPHVHIALRLHDIPDLAPIAKSKQKCEPAAVKAHTLNHVRLNERSECGKWIPIAVDCARKEGRSQREHDDRPHTDSHIVWRLQLLAVFVCSFEKPKRAQFSKNANVKNILP